MAAFSAKNKQAGKPGWSNTAFVVEALVLLIVLIACMAIFVQLFAKSASMASETQRLSTATALAQSATEEFEANPVGVAAGQKVGLGVCSGNVKAAGLSDSDGFSVSCTVDAQPTQAGTLYTAHVTVSDEIGEVYSVTATRYESGVS